MTRSASYLHIIKVSTPDDLVLADRRLFNYLIHNAFSNPVENTPYEIDFDSLSGVFSSKAPDIARLLSSLDKLLKITLTVEYTNTPPRICVLNLLSNVDVDSQARKLHYCFPKGFQDIVHDPELLERCLIQAHFEYKYTGCLYRILVKHAFSTQCDTPLNIELNSLREQLAIEEGKLKNFNDFVRFVLQPSLDELSWYASFRASYDTIKQGRKVIALTFTIHNKRAIPALHDAEQVVPMQRPALFIEDPKEEKAYSYLLNAPTKERKTYFQIAIENAKKKRKTIAITSFDTPDVWFEFCKKELINNIG